VNARLRLTACVAQQQDCREAGSTQPATCVSPSRKEGFQALRLLAYDLIASNSGQSIPQWDKNISGSSQPLIPNDPRANAEDHFLSSPVRPELTPLGDGPPVPLPAVAGGAPPMRLQTTWQWQARRPSSACRQGVGLRQAWVILKFESNPSLNYDFSKKAMYG
jgi:hypothetical protein